MPVSLTDDDLDRLYPAYLSAGPDNCIIAAGSSLIRLLGEDIIGRDIFDIFDFERPARITSIAAVGQTSQELCISAFSDPEIRLRGIGLARDDQTILLVGHASAERGGSITDKLIFSDFAPTDSTLDLLLVREMNRNLLSEAKQISRELDQKRLVAESASKAKSDFLATVSHEIRTPLNGVLGMATYLQGTVLDEEQLNALRIITTSGEGLLSILNEVLDLSKIEAGKFDLHSEVFDLAELVGGSADLFQIKAQEQNLSCTVSPVHGRFFGDSGRLKQILSNLVFNAIKFTQSGGITIQVEVLPDEDPDCRQIKFEISDTGIGMSAETVEGLFNPFYQGDASVTRRFGGTGLGLAISRQLTEMMDGEISATSTLGQGSSFTFTVKLPVAVATPRISEIPFSSLEEADFSDLKVLAAEDNLTNQVVLGTFLGKYGIEPTFVENGGQAVELWRAGNFDVILMDIRMPVMGGEEATQLIRGFERVEGRSRTPIIALTANVMREQVYAYMKAGMDDALAKPMDIDELEGILRRVKLRDFLPRPESRPASRG